MLPTGEYNFYDTEPYTLCFGDSEGPLYVHEGILKQIPFFAKALKYETFISTTTKKFDLHDCDKKAVAQVIHYIVTGKVSAIVAKSAPTPRSAPKLNQRNFDINQEQGIKAHLQAWIVADRLGVEKIANDLVDNIVFYLECWNINPTVITLLARANHENGALCGFLIEELAWQVKRQVYKDWIGPNLAQSSPTDLLTFAAACETLTSSICARVLNVSQTVSKSPRSKGLADLCKLLHNHETNKKCWRIMNEIDSD